MYNRLKALYEAGKLSQEQLEKAVEKGWITGEQAGEILAGKES